MPLNRLTALIVGNPHKLPVTHNGHKISRLIDNPNEDLRHAVQITPLVTKPLTPGFRVGVRGGRYYGGGTSKEAIRRAKRKARKAKI